MILHVDMDAFYASIEQRDNPAIQGKSVIVGGNPQKRGVVATASYEARKFGLHAAMPLSQAFKLCPQGHYLLKTSVNTYYYRILLLDYERRLFHQNILCNLLICSSAYPKIS